MFGVYYTCTEDVDVFVRFYRYGGGEWANQFSDTGNVVHKQYLPNKNSI